MKYVLSLFLFLGLLKLDAQNVEIALGRPLEVTYSLPYTFKAGKDNIKKEVQVRFVLENLKVVHKPLKQFIEGGAMGVMWDEMGVTTWFEYTSPTGVYVDGEFIPFSAFTENTGGFGLTNVRFTWTQSNGTLRYAKLNLGSPYLKIEPSSPTPGYTFNVYNIKDIVGEESPKASLDKVKGKGPIEGMYLELDGLQFKASYELQRFLEGRDARDAAENKAYTLNGQRIPVRTEVEQPTPPEGTLSESQAGGNSIETNDGENSPSTQSKANTASPESSSTAVNSGRDEISNDKGSGSPESETYEQRKAQYEQQQQREALRQRQAEQTRKNTQVAANASVAAILIHTYIAKLIYTGIPTIKGNSWLSPGPQVTFSLGYGIGVTPFFKKWGRTEDGFSGGEQSSTFTIDLNGRIHSYFILAKNYGLGLNGNVTFGHLLEDYKLEYGYGAMGYLGFANFKLMAEYQRQHINFTHYSWIDASSRTSAKAQIKINRLAFGPRISWNKQAEHLDILLALDKNVYRQEGVNLSPYGQNDPSTYTYGGKIQYWRQGVGTFYMEAAEIPSYEEGQEFYFRAGYLRGWDAFFTRKGSFQELTEQHASRNKWVLSFVNPLISWGDVQYNRDTLASSRYGLGFKLIELEREFNVGNYLAFSAGLGLSAGRSYEVAPSANDIVGQGPQYFSEPSYVSRGLELDAPIGLQVYPYRGLTSSFWLSGKYQFSYALYDLASDQNVLPTDPLTNTIRVGLGTDQAWTAKNDLRIGLYYLQAGQLVEANTLATLRSVQLQFAILF